MIDRRYLFPTLIAALTVALSLSLGAPTKAGKSNKPRKAAQVSGDSLESIKIILQKELKKEKHVYRLKDKAISDSLLFAKPTTTEMQLQNMLHDTAMVEEIKTQVRFSNYWETVESHYGISALKAQHAARDPDRSHIPKLYLADSNIVILPGWIVIRKR